MKKKITIALILIVLGYFAYNYFKSLTVEVEEVLNRSFVKETVLTGKLLLPKQSTIKSKISGDIKQVMVKDGTWVEKGDILLKIDSSEYYQNYSVMVQDIEKATNALDQYIDTNRDNLGDPEIIHGREILEIALQQSKSKKIASLIGFNDYNLVAPISGRFYFSLDMDLYEGEYVIINSEIGKIYDNDQLKVKVGVTPDEFGALEGLSGVIVKIEGLEKEVNATISQVSDAIGKNDNGDDVLFVDFDIIDDVEDIYKKHGLNVKVYIKKDAGKKLGVPFTAVFSEKSKDYVYLVTEGKAKKTEIKIINDFGDYLAIENQNIIEKDKIVKVVVEGLKDGKRVKSR